MYLNMKQKNDPLLAAFVGDEFNDIHKRKQSIELITDRVQSLVLLLLFFKCSFAQQGTIHRYTILDATIKNLTYEPLGL